MATINVTLTGICSGGNHLTFTISGDKSATIVVELSELSTPIEQQDIVTFCKIIARMAKLGRTVGQTRTLLQTGVMVSV